MQEKFQMDPAAVAAFKSSISDVRLTRYLTESKGDEGKALLLYHWNTALSQALYLPLQTWEVTLRNRIGAVLNYKFGPAWPYEDKFRRQLRDTEAAKLTDTIDRQERLRGFRNPSPNVLIADLGAGFWVALLGTGYDVPFKWRTAITRIFPNDRTLTRAAAHPVCNDLLKLRNRIAHHEPIYHLPLEWQRYQLCTVIAGMCGGAHAYTEAACTFEDVWNAKP